MLSRSFNTFLCRSTSRASTSKCFSSSSSFEEIPVKNLPTLRDKYKVDWPAHIVAYTLIDNFIWWFKNIPKTKDFVKVYSLNGKLENDATFIAAVRENQITLGTLDSSSRNLKTALKLLDYSSVKYFLSIREIYRPVVHQIVTENKIQIVYDQQTIMKHLKKEAAKKIDMKIPKNFKIKPLKVDHAKHINEVWPKKTHDSENLVLNFIKNNISVGLHNESDELVAWIMQIDTGSLGLLQVNEKHVRKGYGEIVTRAIIKEISTSCNADVTANVEASNKMSTNLFKKLGFQDIDKNSWMILVKK